MRKITSEWLPVIVIVVLIAAYHLFVNVMAQERPGGFLEPDDYDTRVFVYLALEQADHRRLVADISRSDGRAYFIERVYTGNGGSIDFRDCIIEDVGDRSDCETVNGNMFVIELTDAQPTETKLREYGIPIE